MSKKNNHYDDARVHWKPIQPTTSYDDIARDQTSGTDGMLESDSLSDVSEVMMQSSEFFHDTSRDPLAGSSLGSSRRSHPRHKPNQPKIDFDKVGLVNRDAEIEEIRSKIDEIINTQGKRGLIALYGHSGSGKTTLARKAISMVEGTVFVGEGKWFQADNNEPLAVLQTVIRQIGSQISESSPETAQKILKEFEDQHDLVRTWMPDLLDDQDPQFIATIPTNHKTQQTLSDTTNQSIAIEQIKFATSTLLSLIDRPVILLVDDAQWSDRVSLELLRSWLSATNSLQQLVIITCYRAENVDAEHNVSTHLLAPLEQNEASKGSLQITKISVLDFDIDQTINFLCQLLGLYKHEVEELGEVLHKKTGGNPFFLISSLISLLDSGLIFYDSGYLKWMWDMIKVREQTSATENVVELLQRKMHDSKVAVSILPIAALLGSTFSMDLVVKVSQELAPISKHLTGIDPLQDKAEIEAAFEAYEKQGFIDRIDGLVLSPVDETKKSSFTTEISYRFVHDRIQEAALALLPQQESRSLKVMMAKILIESLLDEKRQIPAAASDLIVLWAVDVINEASGRDRSLSKPELVHLNYTAGVRAMSKASFELAGSYFALAIENLSNNSWKTTKQQCLDLYTSAAMAAYSSGETERMKAYSDAVLSRSDVDLLDKIDAHYISIQSYLSGEMNEEACRENVRVLKRLGVRFPKNGAMIALKTIGGLFKYKGTARNLSREDVMEIPLSCDRKVETKMRMLDKFTVVSYLTKPEMFPLGVLEMVRISLKNGMTEYSSVAFVLLGLLMVAGLQDFQAAENCYKLGLAAFERYPSVHVEGKLKSLMEYFLAPWFRPMKDSVQNLLKAYKQGIFSGDLEEAAWAVTFLVEFELHIGQKPLDLLEAECVLYSDQLEEYAMLKQKRVLLTCLRSCRLLQDLPGEETYVFEKELSRLEKAEDMTLVATLYRYEIILQGTLGNYERCATMALKWSDLITKTLVGEGGNIRFVFHTGLSGLIMAQRGQKRYRRLGLKSSSTINSWVDKGSPDCVHLDKFLDAEKALLSGKTHTAVNSFESAISMAEQQGLIPDQALACERYADMLLSMGHRQQGKDRLEDAIRLYEEWGATAKVKALEAKSLRLNNDDTSK